MRNANRVIEMARTIRPLEEAGVAVVGVVSRLSFFVFIVSRAFIDCCCMLGCLLQLYK